MTDLERAWLVGLLEGEGCFHAGSRLKGRGRCSLSVTLRMTDADVVTKAANLMGAKRVHLQIDPRPHAAPTHFCGVYTWMARALMLELLPYMGQRRAEKIRECLKTWDVAHPEVMFERVA